MQKFEYNGKKFHHECFTCAECSQPIGNNSFVPKDEGKLVCMPCYNDKFAQKCGKCNEVGIMALIFCKGLLMKKKLL